MEPYKYRLTSLTFADGTVLRPGDLTVILGPNNSGKSRCLRDLTRWASSIDTLSTVAFRDVRWTVPTTFADLAGAYRLQVQRTDQGQNVVHHLHPDLLTSESRAIASSPEEIMNRLNANWDDGSSPRLFAQYYGSSLLAHLTTEHRLNLVREAPSDSDPMNPSNLLQAFYKAGPEVEAKVRAIVKSAFGKEIALDFTSLQKLTVRVGESFEHVPKDLREALPILAATPKLDHEGDGIRSFVGIVVALLSAKRDVVLVDEPETFLHPPQAFRMGQFLAEQSAAGKQIVVATHSADILRGLLSKRGSPAVVRLDRSTSGFVSRLVDPAILRELMDDPLLSSARVIDGLFYEGAVVVEADSDARFYHAVATKLRPDLDLHFVNADNKQTIPRVIALYRRAGVRCAGIVDIDVLNDAEELRRHAETFGIADVDECLRLRENVAQAIGDEAPPVRIHALWDKLVALTSDVEKAMQQGERHPHPARSIREFESRLGQLLASGKKWAKVKAGGIEAVSESARTDARTILDAAASVGLHINPQGELEGLLGEWGLDYTTDKRGWIQSALKLLAGLAVNQSAQPWAFVRQVCSYIAPSGG